MHTDYCVVLIIVWLQYSVSCVPSTLFQYFARLTLSGVTRGNWCPQPQMNTHRQFFSSLYRFSSLFAIIDNYNLKSTYFSLNCSFRRSEVEFCAIILSIAILFVLSSLRARVSRDNEIISWQF